MAITITAHGPTALRDMAFPDADASMVTSYGVGTTPWVAGDIPYGSGAAALSRLAIGAAGSFLRSDGSVPGWSTLILPNSATAGDLPYASSANTIGMLAKAASGNVLLSGNAPSWGKVDLTAHVTGTLPVANGGFGLATLTAHALYVGNGTGAPAAVAVGATGTVLVGATGADPSFSASPTLTSVSAPNLYGGGTTSSFPQWKRSSAAWHARLGDDSAGAAVVGDTFTVLSYFAGTGTIATSGDIRLGNLKTISARKADNSGNITLTQADSNNDVQVGDSTYHTLIGSGFLKFAGATSSYPALKRNGADLNLKLADDSAYADFLAKGLYPQAGPVRLDDATQGFMWNTRSRIYSPADGVIELTNAATTDFGRLQFGGTTSSFPALKRSTTSLLVRLADDSADSRLIAQTIGVTVADGLTGFNLNKDGCVTWSTDAADPFGSADVGLRRVGTSLLAVTNGGAGAGHLRAASIRGTAVAYASRPASPTEGMLVGITDSNTAVWGATIAGGGANHVLAYYDGTNWTVAGI